MRNSGIAYQNSVLYTINTILITGLVIRTNRVSIHFEVSNSIVE